MVAETVPTSQMDGSIEKVERFRSRRNVERFRRPRAQRFTAFKPRPSVRKHRTRTRIRRLPVRKFWFLACLFALLAHSYLVTVTYMKYETATETVIQMAQAVKPPATAVCYPIWNLLFQSGLDNSSKCLTHLLTNITRIQACENELLNASNAAELLFVKTADPVDFIVSFRIRRSSKNGTNWINKTHALKKTPGLSKGDELFLPGYVSSYYKGPYKCVSFHSVPMDRKTLSIDRMTTGYPMARYFFTGYFKIDPKWTQAMQSARLYIHENGTFPRGSITLPVVANLSKALSFVISYTRIETYYLPAPFDHMCMDYEATQFDSRMDCITSCVRSKSLQFHNSIPSDHLLTRRNATHTVKDKNTMFVSANEEYINDYEFSCSDRCSMDCITKTFYTTLSESAADSMSNTFYVFDVSTRFENPETYVKFIPRLELQAYLIYIAGVFGIWFSASIYHLGMDLVKTILTAFDFIKHIY